MTEAPSTVEAKQVRELKLQTEKGQQYRAGVMFFESVPTELQAPVAALRTLTSGTPTSTSTMVLDGEIVKVETTLIPLED